MKRHLPHQDTVFLDPLYQKSPFTEDNDHEASGKQRIEEDELSISPSDEDINEFLEESNPKEAEVTAKTTEPKEGVELLKSLEAAFTDDELVGTKTNQRLANSVQMVGHYPSQRQTQSTAA